MQSLETQRDAILSEVNLGPGFYVKIENGGLLVGNERLAFFMTPELLSYSNYIELSKISYGRLLEALDQMLENTPVQGNA